MAVCVNPVSTLRTITCDCGRTASFESTTFPPKLAVVYCAYAGERHTTKTPVMIDNDVGDRIVFLLSGWSGLGKSDHVPSAGAQHTPRIRTAKALLRPATTSSAELAEPRGETRFCSASSAGFSAERCVV